MPFDTTLDSLEETRFLNKNKDVFKRLLKETHFDFNELTAVSLIYYKLVRQENPKKPLPSQSFSSMLHKVFGMADDSMIDKIFAALDGITGFVTLKTFVRAMSLFLRGSLKEKIVYCFKCYNLGGLQSNNKIHREHIMILLRNSVYKHQIEDVEEELKDLCEIILKKLDIDLDGVISLSDFKQSVEKQPLLLECFGQCLPDRKHCFAFLTTFTDPKRF